MNALCSAYNCDQITALLRGLLTIAWADGDFDPEEQQLIIALTQDKIAPNTDLGLLEPISPAELATVLGQNTADSENFLRLAVLVALADGIYTYSEDKILHQFFVALGQPTSALEVLRHTVYEPQKNTNKLQESPSAKYKRSLLYPVRDWLDGLEIHDSRLAHFLCHLIPPQCPFERDINLFGHKVVHIPPLCKINPLYEQLVGLRFRSLCYLADECHEDISNYI